MAVQPEHHVPGTQSGRRRRAGRLDRVEAYAAAGGAGAADLGADLVSTTLSGYTPYSRSADGPDLDLVAELAGRLSVPVTAEGRIQSPEQARQAMAAGAWSVVVGTAITAPAAIAERFAGALKSVLDTPGHCG